jgi:hypothetical protein
MFNFKNGVEVPITTKVRMKVRCITKSSSNIKLTVGKDYIVNELSILRKDRCRVKCDTGRNVWYDKVLFNEY